MKLSEVQVLGVVDMLFKKKYWVGGAWVNLSSNAGLGNLQLSTVLSRDQLKLRILALELDIQMFFAISKN